MRLKPTIYFFLLLITAHLHGQQNHLMYFAYQLPQANYQNPAYQSPCKWWVGVPVLSSIHFNYANSLFSLNNLFPEGANTRNLDLSGQINNLKRNNFIGIETNITLFGLGYKSQKRYYNFTVTEKAEIDLFLSRNFASFVWEGNAGYIGETIDINNTGIYLNYYREYAFSLNYS